MKVHRHQKYKDFRKLIKVAKSCTEPDQCITAINYIGAYIKFHRPSNAMRHLCGFIVEYLIDTREHAERGWHKPAWNGWKTKNTYPDLNDYIFDKLGIKV